MMPLKFTAVEDAHPQSLPLFESKKSVMEKQWAFYRCDERQVLAIAQRYDLPLPIARLLSNRGLTLEDIPDFLQPTLKRLMPDPSHLIDMDKSVDRTVKAINQKERIAVFGDYDVDGGTSSAIIHRYFAALGIPVRVYIPDRVKEGYGPSDQAIKILKNAGTSLVLMVDCGTTAFDPLTEAAKLGLDVIIIDHHIAQPALPPAFGIINPNRTDQQSPLKNLCAAGLTFVFLCALQRKLRAENRFSDQPEPDLLQMLDLVALGTVCDVMPLLGLNRAFVTQGLKVACRRQNTGLTALCDAADLNEPPTAYHLGFILGPRVNAGGRVGEAGLGASLLSTHDETLAKKWAHQLDAYNRERQLMEASVLTEALDAVESGELYNQPVILVQGQDWHVGIIGIVASRLKDRYNRPACVVSFTQNHGKGSGRSITGIDLGTAMHTASHKGLILQGGGHAMAAGFSLLQEQYNDFYAFLIDRFTKSMNNLQPTLQLDSSMSLTGITPDFLKSLACLEPFGAGNPTPKFVIQNVRIASADVFGNDHVRCTLIDEQGTRQKAIAFRVARQPLGNILLKSKNYLFHVAGTLRLDSWGGRNDVIVYIDDVMSAS